MFCHKQFGETEDDTFFFEQGLREDLLYAQDMLDQPISDYESERWQAQASQFSGMITDLGIPNLNYSQTFGSEPGEVLTAGFDLSSIDLSSNWPILAILGVGAVLASRGGGKKVQHRRKRLRRRGR